MTSGLAGTSPEYGPSPLTASYRPLAGVPDELITPAGALREVWKPLIHHLSGLSNATRTERFARADQYLRDAGVYFRQSGDEFVGARDWPISHVPVVVAENEWRDIEAGLIQRADLLEEVVGDLYGENHLVREGYLPAALIARNPEWLRPLVGVKPTSGHYLHFLAFEIGRGPDGRWWVLGDRTQAPSGAGFALENRVAMTHVYPDLFRRGAIHRLAAFFRAFRDNLQAACLEPDGRAAILTPGPHNETYYEHAYIARYLGLMLLEGEDIVAEKGHLFVRTISGLQPVSVLWRRLDSQWADPLELDEHSRIGTAGLVDVVRQSNATIINALGTGVLEMRALLAFLPRIASKLLQRDLLMPNIATWWCGQSAERDYVRQNANKMLIGSALSSKLPLDLGDVGYLAGQFLHNAENALAEWLAANAGDLVGQELVKLSTTPAMHEGALRPRPMTIRIFVARVGSGWKVMPGGFARIGATDDPTAIAMRQGGSTADVWIVSDKPVVADTMLPGGDTPHLRMQPTVLPSRAADNLLWLGRYVERTEASMRVLRAYHGRINEAPETGSPLLSEIARFMAIYNIKVDEPLPEGLQTIIDSAVNSASNIRDRFSVDGWLALADLKKSVWRMKAKLTSGDDAAHAMSIFLRKITGFSGLVHENMYRFNGWRFLTIGRSLERAMNMAQLMQRFSSKEAPEGSFDMLLEVGDSVMAHRRRYSVTTSRETVIDMLVLDPNNPRSVLYQLEQIKEQLALLPGADQHRQYLELSRAALRLYTDVAVTAPEAMTPDYLAGIVGSASRIYDLLGSTYLR
ncbi:MAG: circularly permuted type 2 ATP-grasp protein [Beijerinckiaceae bacterium]